MSATPRESAEAKKIEQKFQHITRALAALQLDCQLGAWNSHQGAWLQARYARADSLLQATLLVLTLDPDDPTLPAQAQLVALLRQAVAAFGLAVTSPTPTSSERGSA